MSGPTRNRCKHCVGLGTGWYLLSYTSYINSQRKVFTAAFWVHQLSSPTKRAILRGACRAYWLQLFSWWTSYWLSEMQRFLTTKLYWYIFDIHIYFLATFEEKFPSMNFICLPREAAAIQICFLSLHNI